ncbi:hypothetical protein [Chitinophaga sp. LS1]|uniref:hypothetical protein n=1 Tax=Chitinophaga sp. LS1 TaxID=3051176 RepID=UPI002AAA8502|nr:hypothetical protein [Chitinophaga sp. LS1]WPV67554.1 hypothetical protein QQL36_02295 [Chitinophaga sp. LS1]
MSEIVITGIDFIPDSVNNCLSEKENGQNKLFLSEMEIDGNTGLRRFLFDNNTRNIYHLPKGIDSVPMEVAYIEIPPMYILDPEGYSEAGVQRDESKNIGHVEFGNYKFIGREIPFLTVLDVDFFVDTKN